MDQTFLANDGTSSETVRTILTSDNYSPSAYDALIEDGEKISDGITTTHDSDSACTES